MPKRTYHTLINCEPGFAQHKQSVCLFLYLRYISVSRYGRYKWYSEHFSLTNSLLPYFSVHFMKSEAGYEHTDLSYNRPWMDQTLVCFRMKLAFYMQQVIRFITNQTKLCLSVHVPYRETQISWMSAINDNYHKYRATYLFWLLYGSLILSYNSLSAS